jgi:tRNA pseudouridine38-40 synthase
MTRETPGPRSRNIRIVLAYDGTPYLGWQLQPQGPTLQSVLQDSLRLITGEQVTVKGSGRTDAGVHALGQVANFHTLSTMTPQAFLRALNSVLPPTIAVTGADEVDAAFDAQFSAVSKLYRYRVFNSCARSPFELLRAWHVNTRLDIDLISYCASIILGTHDFSSFRAAGCVARLPVRTVSRCEVTRDGDIIGFELEANGFLRHMVRNIVGTLVDVGRHRFSTDDFAAILAARDRTRAGIAAPPHGLYLVRVDYPTAEGTV